MLFEGYSIHVLAAEQLVINLRDGDDGIALPIGAEIDIAAAPHGELATAYMVRRRLCCVRGVARLEIIGQGLANPYTANPFSE